MKRLLGVLCAICLCAGLSAQTKVIEKSDKKMPAWLAETHEDYLVVTVMGNSLAAAQSEALDEVLRRIIQTVASHVSVSQESDLTEVNNNGQIDTQSTFKHSSRINSAQLPFLQGVSLSLAADVYWQKVRDKQTGKEYYDYSVLYPFSREEQQRLKEQFDALDAEKVAQYTYLEQHIDSIASVEEIKDCIARLNTLCEYFFDEVRLNQAKELKIRYTQLYDALSVSGHIVERGKYLCQVLLRGTPVRASSMPRVTSNCAVQLEVQPVDGAFLITYDDIDCLPEEENFLEIQFRLGGKRINHKSYLSE